MKNITLVDDELPILELLQQALRGPGRTLHAYTDPRQALEQLPSHGADLIVTDLDMPTMHGLEFLKLCRVRFPDAKIVILTGRGGIREAVTAMKEGATDFLTKPLSLGELAANIGKLLELQQAARVARKSHADLIAVGGATPMEQAVHLAETVAKSDTTVLITGETGVGKEVLADFVQKRSARAGQPYIKVNCVALPESLIESELFGHERGAFTGAVERRTGRFERAHRGTVFLDEIAELPLRLQPKLLRVLQSHEVERIGGESATKVDFRLLCATNRDLKAMVKEGTFREDLFYRINVFPIQVPPLRERKHDILVLAREFLDRAGKAVSKGPLSLSAGAEAALTSYAWPGNVRELENAIERATILASSPVLKAGDFWWLSELPAQIGDGSTASAGVAEGRDSPVPAPPSSAGASATQPAAEPPPALPPLEEAERQTLLAILQKKKWNYSKAADELQMSRSTLYAKAARYGIKR